MKWGERNGPPYPIGSEIWNTSSANISYSFAKEVIL